MGFTAEVTVPFGSRAGTLKAGIIKAALIDGGAAGNHTVAGIDVGDELILVLHYTTGAALADLTAEFAVTAANTINNTGGTETTSDQLVVLWVDRS